MTEEAITLSRDVKGVLVPEGREALLPQGTVCWVTQALGGTYTVQLATGRKVRIAGEDGDALGRPRLASPEETRDEEPLSPEEAEKQGWALLKQVHDPEIPVNIVDLGLVYTLKVHRRGDGKLLAEVRMTLTAPGCGMGDVLLDDVRRVLKGLPGVDTIDAKIVFDPVWNPHTMMSEAAKLKLGLL